MDDLEFFAFIGSVALAVWAIIKTATIQYHSLFFSYNPGLGFARLSVWLGFLFAGLTIVHFSASDIVTDLVYIILYLVMGYGLIKFAGQLDPIYRISYRLDVLERRNSVAGFYLGARTLAIALIFSGSMIGEGPGFYVVVGFFGLGWLAMELLIYILCMTRGWKLRDAIIRESDIGRTLVIASWYLAIGMILRLACAGDFVSWTVGFRDFLFKALPVLGIIGVSLVSSNLNRTQEALLTFIYGTVFLLIIPK